MRQLIAIVLACGVSGIPVAAQESWAVKKGLYKTAKDEKKTETTATPAAPEDPSALSPAAPAPVPEVQTPVDPDEDPTRPCYPVCRERDAKFKPGEPETYLKRHALSRKMQIAGGIGMLVGIAMMIPHGDTVTVLNDDFCVTEYRVDAGSCASNQLPQQRKIGLMAIGVSGVLLAIGSIPVTRRVAVGLLPSRTGMTAQATVKWGGK